MLIEKPRIPILQVLLYGLWPGFIKVLLYRLKGYKIGKGVSIGFGSVICAERVEVGDSSSIGFLTILRGTEIRLGRHVQIGSATFLDTPYIEIGEGTKINEQVFVGGLQFADSRFVLGRNCQIMQMSFINPARSIVVGDDTGIGGHCLIFGHTSWLSQFEGYPVEFKPIEIGSSVSLSWRVFVLPGTTIGDGTIIGANSLVYGTVPSRCLAVGYPAKVVSKAPDFPKQLSDAEKLAIFREMVREMVGYFTASGLQCRPDGGRYEVRRPASAWWQAAKGPWTLHIVEGQVAEAVKLVSSGVNNVFLSLVEIPTNIRANLEARSAMWIDVARKERSELSNDLGEEVNMFLKRFGVRTLRASARPSLPAGHGN